ncbi:hypothetical protein MJO28_010867 [Puccinia striiformis f. sp. tritici]|uniref:Phenylalanine--tRNA ligase beta subunit B1 domain-containing protein n=2 Tax=Puccinia striiformis f. sp. tritici TaxID=168172 RepID=A0A0L0UXR6_9BASI|nr:hypothetical protein Pst134EA_019683 [Puccinia striiformis f. sp. tritici]KAH9459534.1 hypothetical protein Pst134EA_019683 [Puccinia striiformis f. sp. tritici]KAI7945172.1 hypothetical protein MJO28_010867 [Puccinia striiformis f. sp. tritici]KAI9610444.1 hypothetical protein H4Q26_006584 [Puccinia striiformis f. sp. tritici PST-130]KNE91842.1 hypothetical protein, variant [Puccinia striiformis f. sp. tritici PST-78]
MTRNSIASCSIMVWNWMKTLTKQTNPEEKPYKLKIEVPANRYDLLCHQGLVLALRTYIGTSTAPIYTLVTPPIDQQWKAHVRKETSEIRPFFASAILRGIQFDENECL